MATVTGKGTGTGTDAVTIRQATEADVDAIVELNGAGNGSEAADEMRSALRHGVMSAEDFAVAIAGDQVVSTVGLLRLQLIVGSVVIPAGEPEWVVTDPTYRGRGLVRALFELIHRWSKERGNLIEIIGGIPYFYRQFGYSYGLRRTQEWLIAPERRLVAVGPSEGNGDWDIRPAVAADIPALCDMETAAQATADVRLPFAENLWPTLLTLPHAPVLVASRASHDGRAEAVTRIRTAPGASLHLLALAAASPAAAAALIAGVRARNPGRSLVVGERLGLPLAGALGLGVPAPRRKWFYVRIGDPVALLRTLVPVLNDRLSGSTYSSESGRLTLSLYRSELAIQYELGRITNVNALIREDESEPDVSLPPELLAPLLFGPGNVVDFEAEPDVQLGRQRDLMAVLMPPLRSDILLW